MSENLLTRAQRISTSPSWANFLFWSWNLIFLAFMFLGFGPLLLQELIRGTLAGQIPGQFLAYGIALTLIPLISVVLGLSVLRNAPERLFAYGYVVEGPLMIMLFVRFFLIREATAAFTLLMVVTGLGLAAFLWQVLDPKAAGRGGPRPLLLVAGLTLMLLVALYASLWLSFYAIPITAWGITRVFDWVLNLADSLQNIRFFIRDILINGILWLPFAILGFILFCYTATLFVLMPVAVTVLTWRAWLRSLRAYVAGSDWQRAAAVIATVIILCAVLFIQTDQQPQQQAFDLLDEPPSSFEESQALLTRSDEIRSGLLNAYLASQRYISAAGEVYHVRDMYSSIFHLSRSQAAGVQRAYEAVARPVLYRPVEPLGAESQARSVNQALVNEPEQAALLYQNFFDQSILEGERETILRSVGTTWSTSQAQEALIALDDREVHLERQEVRVEEFGDWAEVELHEVYRNQTFERQEVVYYFSLPESAVITGLWLGISPDRDTRFEYRVSPRGAAQTMYRNELRRQVDPALVEQIGPRQYRLRIFPVEPKSWTSETIEVVEAPPLYLWMNYRVMIQEGGWPLPQLTDRRNIYWDIDSIRMLNGEPTAASQDALSGEGRPFEETWLPESAAAVNPGGPGVHQVDFPSGERVVISPAASIDLPQLSGDLQLAVVLDRSRSIAAIAAEVNQALETLNQLTNSGISVEVYLTASTFRGEEPSRVDLAGLNPEDIVYYGGQNAGELLAQFEELRAGQDYDAVLVLTDDSGYELGQGLVELPALQVPVWLVHLAGDLPPGYDDATMEVIQASGGGIAGSLDEALNRLAVSLQGIGNSGEMQDLIDGYLWSYTAGELTGAEPAAAAQMESPNSPFSAFAARRLILAEMHRSRASLGQLETLDHLHAMAIEHSIVTPYSSMIVLVNTFQEQMLNQLENRADRFQREHEQVGETVPPGQFAVTGVPEPHEWLLIGLALGMLVWFAYTNRKTVQRSVHL